MVLLGTCLLGYSLEEYAKLWCLHFFFKTYAFSNLVRLPLSASLTLRTVFGRFTFRALGERSSHQFHAKRSLYLNSSADDLLIMLCLKILPFLQVKLHDGNGKPNRMQSEGDGAGTWPPLDKSPSLPALCLQSS